MLERSALLLLCCCCLSVCVLGVKWPSTDSHIVYNGRTLANANETSFDWTYIGVAVAFKGPGLQAVFQEKGNDYSVYVDGQLTQVLNTTSGLQAYTVASGLDPASAHTLHLIKRTEAAIHGVVSFVGFDPLTGADTTELVDPATPLFPPDRKIEMIGDSITCGYGILGTPPCGFSVGTEDSDVTYGALLGRHFNASVHIQCWSGKGIIRNCCNGPPTSPNPFPMYYPRTEATVNADNWQFTSWVPDVVVINLGTNDFSTTPHPETDKFEEAWTAFVGEVRQKYAVNPNLKVFMVGGPMLPPSNPCYGLLEEAAERLGVHYIDMKGILAVNQHGCDGHPNASGHEKMFTIAAASISQVTGWQ